MDKKKHIESSYIFEKAKHYCAYQERCVFELKNKLHEWNVRPEVADKIILSLEAENYLDEERFARVFAGGKFRMKKWGKNKIIAELRIRKLPELIIQIGLDEINEFEYLKTLKKIIEKKKAEYSEPDSFVNRNKIYNFVVSRGYEKHLIFKYL